MTLLQEINYSIFGGAVFIVEVGPTVNGEMVYVRVQPLNTISITLFLLALLVFAIFMYFYISPLILRKNAVAACKDRPHEVGPSERDMEGQHQHSPTDHDTKESADQTEPRTIFSLLPWQWRRLRSRDKFVENTAETDNTKESGSSSETSSPSPPLPTTPFLRRCSLIPDFSPLPLPPPAYATRPNSPVDPSCITMLPSAPFRRPKSYSSTGSAFVPSRPTPLRSVSSPITLAPASPPPLVTPGLGRITTLQAPRSVSESTLHPSSALHVASSAMVYNRDGEMAEGTN